ncbi:MAG: hypothetical protein COU81_02685 [Candidatus Portnoybacteria bacterium CG10_big_fil_rev_8_21_14_0_10_36_7]|uniref:Nudix hydrolase domain-containing protein n=1 Tax=Candidatus Portnoybacteria bacterium CG10_big_fil_rev_8_21_14_0_10_36_7 TaxID=1974812 RepID=A0A2M8KDS6_9BACT|nr:MAG: hypothetical protein COU81_02685 [Candidatus Portnoybacteria bacterium CG10_big_fil_rev_8_21_14_0_10_36_7]
MKQVYPEITVGALISNKQGKILLVKSPKWSDKYTIPGGHVELGESLETALIREMKEEVGLGIQVIKLLNWQEAIYSKEYYRPRHFLFFDFLCETNNQNVAVDGEEITDFIWIEPEKASKLNTDKFSAQVIKDYLKFLQK